MAMPGEPDRSRRWAAVTGRIARARWVLAGAALIALLLAVAGRISLLEMLAVLAFLGLAALIGAAEVPTSAEGRAEAGVAEERANVALAALIEALPDAAYLLDRRGTILAGNGRAAAMHGSVRPGELVSLQVRIPEVVEAIRQSAADGSARRVEYAERVPVDRRLEAYVVPVTSGGAGATPDLMLLGFRDLTQLHLVDEMRADFVANASHELRTPLASLSGFIDTLRGPARDDPAARERFLSIMAEQARRMSRLIDDLLSLSRIEMNERIQPKGSVDLASVIDHVREALAPLARERGVAVEVRRRAERLMVLGDRDELIRLFENLVENALKYGASGKRVEITLAAEGTEAVVSVRDFGPGIAPEHLPRLTERFYWVDVETSRAQGGTGLGLAIVKHILSRHRAKLAIESELGHGAIFTTRFDLVDGKTPVSSTG